MKNNFKIVYIFSCLFSLSLLNAQEFYGHIKDKNLNSVNECYIIFVNGDNNETIDYTIPNKLGEYKLFIKNPKTKNIVVKCQGVGFVSQEKLIEIKSKENSYNLNFNLDYNDILIEEVIVLSERVPIKFKNDTVVYDVSKFKNIGDRKIINVLKNMPGIQVDERTGQIQYKGKPIETMLLDGDDLFGKSYSIGARNISTDLIDKVEAIEDYHSNKLKKGLKKSDDVVINLKFKNDKSKINTELSVGGNKDYHLINFNIINLSKNFKGFGVLNLNNISLNQSPFQRETYLAENRDEIEKYTIDAFNESSANQTNVFQRSYINNLKFGTYNNLFKISDKVSYKNSISLFSDISQNSFSSDNQININNNFIQTTNGTSNSFKPFFFSMSNDLNIEMSKDAILKYTNRLVNNKNFLEQKNLQNGLKTYETQINQLKSYYQQNLIYTKKISSNDLFELNFLNSNDQRKQNLDISNQQEIVINDNLFDYIKFDSERQIFHGKSSYIRKINKFDFEISANQIFDKESFAISINQNDLYDFKNSTSSIKTNTNIEINKRFRVTGRLDLGYSKRVLKNNINFNEIINDDFFINSTAKFKYKFNNNNSFVFHIENENKLNNNYYLISKPFLIDSRTVINNIPSLNFEKIWKTNINYINYNLLKQSSFTFLCSYEEIKNSIVAEQNINEDVNVITYFQTPLTRKEVNISTSKTFFNDFINNKISINLNSNFNRYFNVLNGSNLNNVDSSIYNANIEFNSAFKGFFNYKSNFGLIYIENKQDNSKNFISNNLNMKFETIFKFTKKSFLKVENEVLLPKQNKISFNQLFIDFSFNHIDNNIEYFILSRNLLNNSSFNQVNVTEFSTSIFSNNLFRRYVVFGLNYSF